MLPADNSVSEATKKVVGEYSQHEPCKGRSQVLLRSLSKQLVPWHVLFTIRQVLVHRRSSQQRGKDFISPSDDTSAVCQPCGHVKDCVFDK